MEQQVSLENEETWVLRVLLVCRDLKVPLDNQVHSDSQVLLVVLVRQVLRVSRVRQAHRVLQDLLDKQEH